MADENVDTTVSSTAPVNDTVDDAAPAIEETQETNATGKSSITNGIKEPRSLWSAITSRHPSLPTSLVCVNYS